MLITDWSIPDLLPRLREVLAVPGALAVQHRHPGCGSERFVEEAIELAALCRPKAIPLFVNGSIETALRVEAHLHLPVGYASAKAARAQLPPGRHISIAAHEESELQPEADIALLSPVFPTESKPGAKPLGPQGFHRLAAASRLTAFALGGISPERIAELMPVAGVAVMSNVLRAREPGRALERLFAALPS